MALNTYLHLTLDGTPVLGSVTQKGKEGTIEVNALEWSFDSDGNVGEVKFTSDIDMATVRIGQGLKTSAVVDALFDFWTQGSSGSETLYFTLHGATGKVTSVNLWMLNNNDPNLQKYATTMQYTMSFASITETWVNGGLTVTIP
jgi:Protein of unknown function (DUF796).